MTVTMIKKIKRIAEFGSFDGFNWNASIPNNNGRPVVFKKVNVLYGRNYSGKTTLSRIFRALGGNTLPYGYESGKFTLVAGHHGNTDSDRTIENNPGDLASFPGIVRVFNRDFVRENLSFLHDDDGEIKPLVVLGDESVKDQRKIDDLNEKLGASDEVPGLRKEEKDAKTKWESTQQDSEKSRQQLNKKLRKQAAAMKKPLSLWGYDINDIIEDIGVIRKQSRTLLTQHEVDEFKKALDDTNATTIQSPVKLDLRLAEFVQNAKELVEREIKVEKPVSEIASTPEFRKWIQQGLKLHREKNRGLCEFCQQALPKNLLMQLESYFNDDADSLTADIDALLEKVDGEKKKVLQYADEDAFATDLYVTLVKDKQQNALNQFNVEAQKYAGDLETLVKQLKQRKNDILNRKEFKANGLNLSNLLESIDALHNIINEANEFVSDLTNRQKSARKELRLNQVREFMKDINYPSEKAAITRRERRESSAKTAYKAKSKDVSCKIAEVKSLKAKLGNEATGAEKVNDFLRLCFGHEFLSLVVREADDNPDAYQFVVQRNNGTAQNLSEGERNLIAFCYFMASLSDHTIDAPKDKLIVWIDDPASSLDANHIFAIYTLIRSKIVEMDDNASLGGYAQFFVATHNLDLLKYLINDRDKRYAFFYIERRTKTSKILAMPKYLKACATEFNQLFAQINTCAEADEINDKNYDDFVTFGNNARKFLELFLCYLYPSETSHNPRMHKFFGGKDSVPQIFAAKVTNEFSHWSGSLDMAARPLDVNENEIKKVAKDILCRIKKYNPTQHCELMASTNDNNTQN